MPTHVEFIDPLKLRVETSEGDVFILGFRSTMNYQIEQQYDSFVTKTVIALFDEYYRGDDNVLWGPIMRGFYRNQIDPFFWSINDRDKERERIGERIKEDRKSVV